MIIGLERTESDTPSYGHAYQDTSNVGQESLENMYFVGRVCV